MRQRRPSQRSQSQRPRPSAEAYSDVVAVVVASFVDVFLPRAHGKGMGGFAAEVLHTVPFSTAACIVTLES